MSPRTISLDVKYPAVMTGLALLISATFVWLGQRELTRVLQESAGERLRSSGTVIANLLAASVGPMAETMRVLAARPEMRRALADPRAATAVDAARGRMVTADSARIATRLVSADGATLTVFGIDLADSSGDWATAAARAGRLSVVGLTIGPIRTVGGDVAAETAYPVHARDEGESLLGWIVDTRRVQGRGVAAVKQLAGSATLIIGSLDAGAWTDLEGPAAAPPPGVVPDSLVVFSDSPRGAGVGVAVPIAGTPWVVWSQNERAVVLAPLADFRRRVAPVALLLALLTLVLVWRVTHRVMHRVVVLTDRVDRLVADPEVVESASAAPETLVPKDEIERLEGSFDAMSDRLRRQMQLEGQLRQAQKLEAVGRLAGGVAHDFNNVLTVIVNYSEMLRDAADDGSQTAKDLDQVLRAADRATRLTRQLLAFSRRQVLEPRLLGINDLVRDVHDMLRRLIPSNIEIDLQLSEPIAAIFADPIQIEQVLVNLAVNAADAMPDGGRLTLRTAEGELDIDDATPDGSEQRFACLVVHDTGQGMDRESLSRIFEPFYTTKAQGKGTGLGLATVHGIVTQLGGRVWVYSEPGKGTTFKTYFPIATADGTAEDAQPLRHTAAPQGVGTVLVVEDDEAARDVTARVLQKAGFEVRVAPDGATALAALHAGPLPRVVLSDLMMPGVDGAELARRIRDRWPQLPVIIMSGYADVSLGADIANLIVEKPFTARAIVDAIQRVSEGRGSA